MVQIGVFWCGNCSSVLALKLQAGRAEVQQQPDVPIRRSEVIHDLDFIGFCQRRDCLQFTNQKVVHHQIGYKVSDDYVLISDRDSLADFDSKACSAQLVSESVEINRFQKAWPKRAVHLHGQANYLFSDRVIFVQIQSCKIPVNPV
ncbi:MAG: hypothetical protein QOJ05_516 [Verrucomicrobiota bacterium]